MKAEEKIRKELERKNWKIYHYEWERVQYYGEGREGGFTIDIDLEYQDIELGNGTHDSEIMDKYYEIFEKIHYHMMEKTREEDGHKYVSECDNGYIMAYNLETVMYIINQLPDRLTIK